MGEPVIPAPKAATDLGFLLTRASVMVARAVNEALGSLGLRARPYMVLSLACDEHRGVGQRHIAADMGLDPSQIVAIVAELESRGLVARTPDPGDRRNKLVVATDEGRALCDEARRLSEQVSDRYFADVDATLMAQIRHTLYHSVFRGDGCGSTHGRATPDGSRCGPADR